MKTERRLRIALEFVENVSREQYRAMFAAIVAWNPRFAPRKLARETGDAPDTPEPWHDARWADVAALAAGTEWRAWRLLGDDAAIGVSREVATTRVALVLAPPATDPFELMIDLLGRLPAGAAPGLAMAFDQESKQDGGLVAQGLEELRDVPPAFFMDRERIAAIGGGTKLQGAEAIRELAGGLAVRVRPLFGKVSADARKRTQALATALGLPRSFLGGSPAPREITIEQLPVIDGPKEAFRGVWSASPEDAWAVGDRGLIARWDGKDWTALELFEEGEEPWLYGVGGLGELAWAVGEHGRVLAWDGTRWTEQPRASEEPLYRVHAISRELVVAVGDDVGHLVEWNGTSWRRVPSGTDQPLSAVSSAGDELWAVGERGAIVRRVDGKWIAVDSPARDQLTCVSVVAPGDVWVAGVRGQVFHHMGGAWTPSRPATPSTSPACSRAARTTCGSPATPARSGAGTARRGRRSIRETARICTTSARSTSRTCGPSAMTSSSSARTRADGSASVAGDGHAEARRAITLDPRTGRIVARPGTARLSGAASQAPG